MSHLPSHSVRRQCEEGRSFHRPSRMWGESAHDRGNVSGGFILMLVSHKFQKIFWLNWRTGRQLWTFSKLLALRMENWTSLTALENASTGLSYSGQRRNRAWRREELRSSYFLNVMVVSTAAVFACADQLCFGRDLPANQLSATNSTKTVRVREDTITTVASNRKSRLYAFRW